MKIWLFVFMLISVTFNYNAELSSASSSSSNSIPQLSNLTQMQSCILKNKTEAIYLINQAIYLIRENIRLGYSLKFHLILKLTHKLKIFRFICKLRKIINYIEDHQFIKAFKELKKIQCSNFLLNDIFAIDYEPILNKLENINEQYTKKFSSLINNKYKIPDEMVEQIISYLRPDGCEPIKILKKDTANNTDGHTDGIRSLKYSIDGKWLASGSCDNTVKIWDTTDYNCVQTLTGHTDWVHSVSFSNNSLYLATGSYDNTVKIWRCPNKAKNEDGETSKWECIQTLTQHSSWINCVSFSHNGRLLATASEDSTIKIWRCPSEVESEDEDTSNWSCIKTLNKKTYNTAICINFSHDDKFLVAGLLDHSIKKWRIGGWENAEIYRSHSSCINSIKFSPNDTLLASGAEDNYIFVWNTTDNTIKTLMHEDQINGLSFSKNGKLLISGSNDETIKLWDTKNFNCLQTLHAHGDWIQSVAFSVDSKIFATGAGDSSIIIWKRSLG